MGRYRNAWRTVVALVGLLGMLVMLERLGLIFTATLYVLTGVLVAALAAAIEREDVAQTWRARLRPGVVGGAVALATLGMVILVGPGALFLLAAGALSSPPALRWFRRYCGSDDRHVHADGSRAHMHTADLDPLEALATTPTEPDGLSSAPESMSDDALCLAWRRSYVDLQRSGSVTAQLLVVQERQRYLDELERRNPSGLSDWLASGARAAGDPSRFIVPRADEGHPPAA